MTNLIEISDIHHKVSEKTSIDIDQLFFQDGPIYAITGESGAGKSALLELLSLTTTPSAGEISVFTTRVTSSNRFTLRRRMGYLPQLPFLFQRTVEDNVGIGLRFRGEGEEEIRIRVQKLLKEFELVDMMQSPVRTLSAGKRQVIAFLRTIAPHPEILLLDEPTEFMDGETYTHFINYLRMLNNDRGITIICVTKSRDLIERLANISISMRFGKIIRIRTGEHQTDTENGSGLRPS